MPRGDRTGPYGLGPMTGRGAGYCAGYDFAGFENGAYYGAHAFGRGRGFRHGGGYGRGFGRGFGYGFGQRVPRVEIPEEKQFLEERISSLKESIKVLENRLKHLNNEEEKKGGNYER